MDLCHPLGSMLSHYCFPKVSGLTVRKHFKRLTKPTIGSAVSLSFSAIHNPRCVFTFPFIYSWKCPRPSYLLFIYFLQLIIFNSWEGTSFFLSFFALWHVMRGWHVCHSSWLISHHLSYCRIGTQPIPERNIKKGKHVLTWYSQGPPFWTLPLLQNVKIIIFSFYRYTCRCD